MDQKQDLGKWAKPVTEFTATRQDLPHLQKPESYYFGGSTTHNRLLLTDTERAMVLDAIKFHDGKKYQLDAAVVMDDHYHVIFKPLPKGGGDYSLPEIFHSINSYTAHQLKQKQVWQRENYDHIVRNDKDYISKLQYLIYNPVVAGFCEDPKEYPYLYCPAIGKY